MLPPRTSNPWRLLGLIILLSAILILAIYGRQWWPHLEQMVVAKGHSGFFLFMFIFIVLTTLCFPVSVLGFTAGALYGPWLGLLLIFPSGLFSGTLMFFLGRGLFRGFVKNLLQKNRNFQEIESIAANHALKLNLLTRLSPFNFGLASYALAVGKTNLQAYLVGLLVVLPSMTAQVWVGALAGEAGKTPEGIAGVDRIKFLFLGVGVVFFLLLISQVGQMIRQALLPNEKE